MRPMITDIVRPKTVAEAVRAKSAPGAAWLGGGTWLNSGRAPEVTTLVSLEHLGLGSITTGRDACTIGAMATFQDIADSSAAPSALRDAVKLTASRTLRCMVTLGGELGLKSRDSAVIPVLIALEAEVSVAGKKKPVPIQKFVNDTSAGLVLGVSIPAGRSAAVGAVSRTSHSPRSLVVAVTAGHVVVSDCQGQVTAVTDPASFAPRPDMHASVAYKRYMIGVLVSQLRAGLKPEARA